MSKAIRLSILVPLALSWLCGSALAQGGVTNSTKNPAQIATLHWYEANLTANFPVASVGGEGGLGFDGANIWATNGRGVVTKVRASDGAVLGVFSDSQVTDCHRTVYDGANLWIGCSNGITGGILDKIRASDGAVIGRSSGLGFIQSIAFDGASVWVTTIVSSFTQLVKVRASDGAALGFFNIDGANGVVFDGANIWVTNSTHIMKVRPSDGSVLATFAVPGGAFAPAFDGANVWVASGSSVTKVRASDGTLLGTFSTGLQSGVVQMVFDGANIWVSGANAVSKLRASDGAVLGTFSASSPSDMVFDGANIWVANGAILSRM